MMMRMRMMEKWMTLLLMMSKWLHSLVSTFKTIINTEQVIGPKHEIERYGLALLFNL
jgi:hypothetical protein